MTSQSSRSTKKSKKSRKPKKSEKGVSRGPKRGRSKRLALHAAAVDTLDDAPISVWAFQGLKPIYRADEYWCTAVIITSDNDIIDFLRQNLSPQVKEKFRKTVFGKFLELPNLRLSKQLIHSLLLRELSQPKNDCIYLNISGKVLYFGIEYFLLISGLKAVAEDGFRPFETGAATEFCKTYFGEKNYIKKADIEALLKNDGNGKHKLASDKDCLILALVYFISYYLMGIDPTVRVPAMYFDCVKTGDYAKAAWGDLSFQATINGLKKNGKEKKRPSSYRIEGCPLIFQVWFFEVCGACQGLLCDRNQVEWTGFRPRMFNWRNFVSDFRRSVLDNEIFNRKAKQLHFSKIEATDEEIENLSLEQFFPFHDPLQLDHQDVYTQVKENKLPIPSTSRPQASNYNAVLSALASLSSQVQQGFDVFNRKIDKTNKRLNDLETFLKKCTTEGKEKVSTVAGDELQISGEAEKDEEINHNNGLEEDEGEKDDVQVDHENTGRSLVPYKPFTFPFQKTTDPCFDPVARSNGSDLDKQGQEQAVITDDDNFEVKNSKPAGVNTAKAEKREREAAVTLERQKDTEEEDAVEVKRKKIDVFDNLGRLISIDL